MSDFTALKTAINNAIRTNGNEEITGAVLQVILDAMVETLGDSAITNLENTITTEISNRENAVGGVADDLAAEVQARQALDYNVNNRINAEEYNRQNADAALSQTMNQGFQTLGSQMNALNEAISALNAAYQNGFLYGGIATPSSSPSNGKCFYIALQGGIYTNFGGVGVIEGINIIKNDNGWKVEHIYDQTTLLNEFYLLRQQVIQAITSFAPIVIQGDVTNAPDEEDLTSNANHLLQFKNNAYSPLEFSGFGRKYLRKNIAPLSESAPFNGFVEGVNAEETLSGTPTQIFWDRMNTRFVGIKDGVYYLDWTDSDNYVPASTSLVYMYNGTPYQWTGSDFIVDETEVTNLVNCLTQDMINEANTIYIIRYDYTLKENITIPANCVLEFDGGSITASGNNGTITGNNTGIQAGLIKIFNTDVILGGTWNVAEAYPEWFGAIGDGATDDRPVIQKTIDSFVRTRLLRKTYFINSTNNGIGLSLGRGRIIQGTGMFSTTLDSDREQSCIKVDSNLNIESVIVIASLCELHNIGIEGNKVNENSACVSNSANESRISLINVAVAGAHYGFKMTTYLSNIKQCIASYCDIGFHFTGRNVHNTSLTLETCFAVSCKTNGYYFEKITYSTIISCAADGCGSKDINAIDYAYKLFNCINILFSACGCEECMKVIWGRDIDNISFINCNWYLNKYILELPNDYKLTDIVYLRDSHCVTIYGCQFNISALNDYIESNGRLINLYSSSDAWTILYFMCAAAGRLDYAHFGSSSGLNIDKVMKYTYPNAELTAGGFAGKPTFSTPSNRRGYMYFDTVKNKPYWQKGSNKWSDADGVEYDVKKSGTFAERPAISEVYIGYMYFCTSGASIDGGATEKTNFPIFAKSDGYVDANGVVVVAAT